MEVAPTSNTEVWRKFNSGQCEAQAGRAKRRTIEFAKYTLNRSNATLASHPHSKRNLHCMTPPLA